jgi:hypothetical protein
MVMKISITVWAILFVAALLSLTPDVSALSSIQQGVNAAHGNGQPYELFGSGGVITSLTNVLLFVAGALSVVMIIVGGLRYAISGGDSGAVTTAKNTILYAIVGLVIALVAFALVNFVLTAFAPGASGGYTNV